MTRCSRLPLGATFLGEGKCRFLVWAPKAHTVDVHLVHPEARHVRLEPAAQGYFHGVIDGVALGSHYFYRLDQAEQYPDPASRYQPKGVHGPSEVIDPVFPWRDAQWRGLALRDYILYELHVGTFTPEGTFDAIIPHLEELSELGITVIELMPIGQFPGSRNWGYDGVYGFAAQSSYGGPDGLRRLVDACHRVGLGVALDVVYNHFGPEGNYLDAFGHYFTDRYRTPWGRAVNFDGSYCDEVRRFFIDNALSWITDFHIDSLRLDAVHAIFDESARPFLRELATAIHERAKQINRCVTVIAECDRNDARQTDALEVGGYGLDSQWNDDFHHCLHVLLTGEKSGYYADFGGVRCLAKAMAEGFVYDGQFSVFRRRRHGSSSRHLPAERFVICAQNHDQVGNRAQGERLASITSYESLKLAAAAVLLSPGVPLLFMGEEYGETAPFLYFVSFADERLIEAVRRGRREEFAAFAWAGEVPDPQAESTFLRAKLDRELLGDPRHAALRDYYRELIRLRKTFPALATLNKEQTAVDAYEDEHTLVLRRWQGASQVVILLHLGEGIQFSGAMLAGAWRVVLDSAQERWQGPGSQVGAQFVVPGTDALGPASLALSAKQVVVLVREEN